MTPEPEPSLARILQVVSRVTGSDSRSASTGPGTALRDVGVSSYLLFRFIRELEAELGIRFRDHDLSYSRFETIGDVTRLVEDHRRIRARTG